MLRSNAYALLTRNTETEELRDELREKITPESRALIGRALAGISTELAAPTFPELEAMTVELARAIALTGGGWPPEQRGEWIDMARAELMEFPWRLVREAIVRARRKVAFANQFVPWVIADIEEETGRLRAEHANLARLAEIAKA